MNIGLRAKTAATDVAALSRRAPIRRFNLLLLISTGMSPPALSMPLCFVRRNGKTMDNNASVRYALLLKQFSRHSDLITDASGDMLLH